MWCVGIQIRTKNRLRLTKGERERTSSNVAKLVVWENAARLTRPSPLSP